MSDLSQDMPLLVRMAIFLTPYVNHAAILTYSSYIFKMIFAESQPSPLVVGSRKV